MNSGTISIRYARALFNYALEKKAEDVVFSEMQKVLCAFNDAREFKVMMDKPTMRRRDKLDLISKMAGDNLSDIFLQFVDLLVTNNRENHLQTVALSYSDLYRKYKNITVGKLITATSLDSSVTDKIKKIVESKYSGTVELETKIDPSIAGGFVLFVDTYRLDASVRTQLNKIKNELLAKNKKIA